MELILNCLSGVAAMVAAYLWFRSARVEAPKEAGVVNFGKDFLGYSFDRNVKNLGHSPVDESKFYNAMSALLGSYKRQSKLSGQAAIAAGVAAVLQVFVILIHLICTTAAPK